MIKLSLKSDRNKYVIKRDLNDDCDGAHLTTFGIEFQREEAKNNESSPSVTLLCAGLLRRGMVYELERVLRVYMDFSAACQRHFNQSFNRVYFQTNVNKANKLI